VYLTKRLPTFDLTAVSMEWGSNLARIRSCRSSIGCGRLILESMDRTPLLVVWCDPWELVELLLPWNP